MFGLKTYRHRHFETSFPCEVPAHGNHVKPQIKMGRPVTEDDFIQVVGHFSGVPLARKAMGIDWLGQKELAQAIPPAYSEYIARQYAA
jgi:DNA (cytosine-5)-methyltransferase 1